jgi:hypothetical protein
MTRSTSSASVATKSSLVKPAYRNVPRYRRTIGPEVADLGRMVNFAPDAEQEMLLNDTFAIDEEDLPTSAEVAIIACRQNLKTGYFKLTALGWLFVTNERDMVWSAHKLETSQAALRDLTAIIDSHDFLSRRVRQIYKGAGDMAIEMMSGARMIFKTRTQTGARGLTGDKMIMDEGFALQAMHMGALIPLLSTRPRAQILYGSSAGLADSEVLRAVRDRGRAGTDSGLAYTEYCAPDGGCESLKCSHRYGEVEGCALDNEENWYRGNPTLGKRISLKAMRRERIALPASEFARERLGWWDESSGDAVIPAGPWLAAQDARSRVIKLARFALDISPSRDWAAIGVAGIRPDDLPHLEVTSRNGVIDHRPGTEWILPRMRQLKAAHPDMIVNVVSGSAAASFIPELAELKIKVHEMSAVEVAAACGRFYDLAIAREPGLRHIGQECLTQAVADATQLFVADKSFTWARRKSSGDITPLYVVTLALAAVLAAVQGDYNIEDSIY